MESVSVTQDNSPCPCGPREVAGVAPVEHMNLAILAPQLGRLHALAVPACICDGGPPEGGCKALSGQVVNPGGHI